ncbi:MAG: thrombospondin type 3 repeat-containing protein [Flavobacterium circumlabens]|uniref:thrombospondin type 3 repeat-containing protein n=1 Tax=Flavobacterium circumlabens TaxID=2133765 RepID=UPI0032650E0D
MYINKHLIAFIFTLFSLFAFSQQEETLGDRKQGNQLNGQPTLTVVDSKFAGLGQLNVFTSVKPGVTIHFGFNDNLADLAAYAAVYYSEIELNITPYNNTGIPAATPTTVKLKIKHDNVTKGKSFNDYAVYRLPGVHKADVQITSVNYTDANNAVISISNAPAYLALKFNTERYYNLQLSATQYTSVFPVSHNLIKYNGLTEETVSTGAEELIINWTKDAVAPAVEYELEWTWIDNYGKENNKLAPEDIALTEQDFKRNSTRIQTKEISYRIPLIYSKGYLVYRIRPVGRFLDNTSKNFYGQWSSGLTDAFTKVSHWPHVEIDQAHENGKKNWQYQASFAEDGKKKEVVSYFDGSLRNRQTVTKTNTPGQELSGTALVGTQGKAIVGEVIYDTQGRPAIEVLPSPVNSSGIHFYDGLNKNASNSIYSHNDFDWDNPSVTDCTPIPVAIMSNADGAGKYYSENNAVYENYKDLVPNAGGYPFSQVEYTPDNTGRIKRKGGVGKDHQIGTGHEMQYFYGQPKQEELNRLFGYKVGDFSRYKKNIVIDPNKQVSVSYLDPQGRTVATALVGDNPKDAQGHSTLVSLDDEKDETLHLKTTTNLLSNNDKYASGNNGIEEDGIRLNTPVAVVKEGEIKFAYTLNKPAGSFTDVCLTAKQYPFVYDWSIALKNDCANELLIPSDSLTLKIGNYSITSSAPVSLNFEKNYTALDAGNFLKVGTYPLSKDLRVDYDALNKYADDYIAQLKLDQKCLPDYAGLEDDITEEDCNVTCKSCEESLACDNLSPAECAAFKLKLSTDVSSLGDIAERESFIVEAEKQYVIKNLNAFFTTNTFAYNGSQFTGTAADQQVIAQKDILVKVTAYKLEFRGLLSGCRELCSQPINVCNLNLEILLGDVSPHGQYGSVDGLESEDDEINDPASSKITDPLSVFNDQNQLLYGGYKTVTNTDPATNETENIKVSNYNWRNPSGSYKEENGSVSKIRVQLIGDGIYKPSLVDNVTLTDDDRDPDTDDPNVYLVEPKYLEYVADFIPLWKPSWANALLPYHPEYQYYVYNSAICEKFNSIGDNSDGFDEKLRALDYANGETGEIKDVNNKIFATTADGIITKLLNVTSQDADSDPYYTSKNNLETKTDFDLRQYIMYEALNGNFEGIMLANEKRMNMLQVSYYFAIHTNGIAPESEYEDFINLSTADLLTKINNIQNPILKQRIWTNFKTNYIALKQKTRTVFSHIYAATKNNYNDCIGNKESTDTFVTLFKKYDYYKVARRTNFLRITELIDAIPENPAIPSGSEGIEWACSEETSSLFANKEKRFVPADFGFDSSLEDAQVIADIKNKTDSALYMETGKCPMAFEMEYFLKGLVDTTIQPDGLLISGFKTTSMPYLTKNLFNAQVNPAFNLATASETPKIKTFEDALGNLNIGFTYLGNDIATPIVLSFVTNNSSYQDACGNSPNAPKWEDIVGFKSFYYIPESYDKQNQTYQFQIIGIVKRKGTIASCDAPEEIIIQGTTKARVGECGYLAEAPCDKKDRFDESFRKLVLNLQSAGTLRTADLDITANPVFTDGYLYTYLRIKQNDVVKWKNTAEGVSISVNDEKRINLNLGSYTLGSERISNIVIGNLQGSYNLVRVTTRRLLFSTRQVSAKITSGNTSRPLYLTCCSPCGEWDSNGNGTGDACDGGDEICGTVDTDGDGIYDNCDNCPTTPNPNQEPCNTYTPVTSCSVVANDELTYENNIKNILNDFLITRNHEVNAEGDFYKSGSVSSYSPINTFVRDSKLVSHFQKERTRYTENNFKPVVIDKYSIVAENTLVSINFDENSGSVYNRNFINFYDINIKNAKRINYIDVTSDLTFKINFVDSQGRTVTQNGGKISHYTFTKITSSEAKAPAVSFCPFMSDTYPPKTTSKQSMNSSDDLYVSVSKDGQIIAENKMALSAKSAKNAVVKSIEAAAPVFSCSDLCIPSAVAPVVCGAKWLTYRQMINSLVPDYKIPENMDTNAAYFCEANFGYISTDYLQYLTKLEITSSKNPLFLTLSEFGSTKLRYGNTVTSAVVNEYYNYIQALKAKPTEQALLWYQFADKYAIDNKICPPAIMVPTFDLEIPVEPGTKTPCEIYANTVKAANKQEIETTFYAGKKEEFRQNYLKAAFEGLTETLTQTSLDKEYQYTLYYYDQAGNLIQTVPPEGVHRLKPNSDASIKDVRANNPEKVDTTPVNDVPVAPDHKMQTQYRYNSLNQLVWQKTPDGGITKFAYDGLGRIVASQNANQSKSTPLYSYTRYDGLGRITEAGQFEVKSGVVMSINENGRLVFGDTNSTDLVPVDAELDKFPYNQGSHFDQVTKTLYDVPVENTTDWFTSYAADNSHKRVTAVMYYDKLLAEVTDIKAYDKYNNAILYDYDVHGNVKELIHHTNNNAELTKLKQERTKIVYDYDLISGKVNQVTYQPNSTKDQFIHRYEYDADNRIKQVYTSKDNVIWEKEANYLYYEHGPLARVEIGDKDVQGLDYIYTLQGWLKGVNAERLGSQYDAGKDGLAVAKDAFGFALNYYTGDYKSRFNVTDDSTVDNMLFNFSKGTNALQGDSNLYNGNIKEMVTSLLGTDQQPIPTQFNYYKYDQLNRIKSMDSKAISYAPGGLSNNPVNGFKSDYKYDRNGNITYLNSWAPLANGALNTTQMDQLTYNYLAGTNKLTHVNDAVPNEAFTADPANPNDTSLDIDNQGVNNYGYDEIGQLVKDAKENLDLIKWRVDGKVESVTKNQNKPTQVVISFEYDGLGNRIAKTVATASATNTTYYQRDAQGNVLSTYKMVNNGATTKYYLMEQDIYGSSRLGVERGEKEITADVSSALKNSKYVTANEKNAIVAKVAQTQAGTWGLGFTDGTATWPVNGKNAINLFDNKSPKTEAVSIISHFKIDDTTPDKSTLAVLHGSSVEGDFPGDGSISYRSSIVVGVQKMANGNYTPTFSLVKYRRNHNKYTVRIKLKKRTRFSYRSYASTIDYTVKPTDRPGMPIIGIPEKEWDFKADIKLNQATSNYDITLNLNGNIYTAVANPSNTILNGEENKGMNNGEADLSIIVPQNSLGASTIPFRPGNDDKNISLKALKSAVCDFTYSINNGEEPEDIKVNKFALDEGGTNTSSYSDTSIEMKLSSTGVKFENTYCSNPYEDTDGDGVFNSVDNCPYTFNPKQEDGDDDGIGDVCDNCLTTQNHDQLDTDGDGRGDVCDNCIKTPNFDQKDTDGDKVGDVCDNCRTIANADQKDTNANGIGDVCEGLDQGEGNEELASSPFTSYRFVGDKNYELSNHLGNVLSVITDRPLFAYNGQNYSLSPDVLTFSDYYPFGMLVPNRHKDSKEYRYGFNGKELDNELKGEGNSYDFGARIYDSRIARWFSTDPKESKYSYLSPYSYAENNPVFFIDPDGKDAIVTIKGNTITVKAVIYIDNSGKSKINVANAQKSIMKVWGGNHKDSSGKYNVKFDIVVMEKPTPVNTLTDYVGKMPEFTPFGVEKGSENIIIPEATRERSEVASAGGNNGKWGTEDLGTRYAHETGHLLGLDDLYSDIYYIKPTFIVYPPKDTESTVYYDKSPTELMAMGGYGDVEKKGKVSVRSIDAIVAFTLENQKNGKAFINEKTVKGGLAQPTEVEKTKAKESLNQGWNIGKRPDDKKKKG